MPSRWDVLDATPGFATAGPRGHVPARLASAAHFETRASGSGTGYGTFYDRTGTAGGHGHARPHHGHEIVLGLVA